jgi:(S)-mandelate dehydrogenase
LASPRVINIHDLRKLAHDRLPKVVFDYLDGRAESEITLRENCWVFDDVTFRPRQAVAIPECDVERTLRLLGCPPASALNSSYLNIPKQW